MLVNVREVGSSVLVNEREVGSSVLVKAKWKFGASE